MLNIKNIWKYKFSILGYTILTGGTYFLIYSLFRYEIEPTGGNSLLDLESFKYLINNDRCQEYETTGGNLLAVILIASHIRNRELRYAHRKAYSQVKLGEQRCLRIFLIGESPDNDTTILQQQLLQENQLFNDIVQGNFIDTQRNLTYKIGMGLKWATTKCLGTRFIIKTNDDIIFDFNNAYHHLNNIQRQLSSRAIFIFGNMIKNFVPERNPKKDFYVTFDEYKNNTYEDFADGMLYLTNLRTARKLILAAEHENYFWIENIFFTGILRTKINCTYFSISKWFTDRSSDLYCCLNLMQKFGNQCNFIVAPLGDGGGRLLKQFSLTSNECYYEKCEVVIDFRQICKEENFDNKTIWSID